MPKIANLEATSVSFAWTRGLFLLLVFAILFALPALGQNHGYPEGVEIHPTLGPIGVNDHRLPYHLDSIMGLGLVAYAIAVAVLLNHSNPSRRVLGVWGAAIGCLGVSLGTVWLDVMGYFAEVRPPLFPPDEIKPTFMRVLAALFGIGGLVLIWVANGQSKRQDVLSLQTHNEPNRYGRRARYFHWIIAILFLMLIPMGIFTSMIPVEHEYRQAYYVIHKSLGLTVLILAFARLVWLIASPKTKLDPSLSWWEKLLAHSAHYTLYFFLFAFPISGFVMSTYGGKLSHFFFWDTPLFWAHSEQGVQFPGLLHKVILPYLFYLVFLAHIAGALKHRFIDKHSEAFRRMVT